MEHVALTYVQLFQEHRAGAGGGGGVGATSTITGVDGVLRVAIRATATGDVGDAGGNAGSTGGGGSGCGRSMPSSAFSETNWRKRGKCMTSARSMCSLKAK